MPSTRRLQSILKSSASGETSATTASLPRSDPVSQQKKNNNKKKEVCWNSVAIYEFPTVLGDNPSVTDGAPLAFGGWKHKQHEVISIDYHEYVRRNSPRRRGKQLVLDAGTRGTFLLSHGYSITDLIEAATEVDKIKESRRCNMKASRLDSFRNIFLQHANNHSSNNNTDHHNKQRRSSLVPRILAGKSA